MTVPEVKISSSFQIALPDYPVSCRIANPALFGKVLPDGRLLVFGGYDLIFCCNCGDKKQGDFYRTVNVPHTLMESVPPEKTGLAGNERVEIALERSLTAQVRAGKPSRAGIWELLTGVLKGRVWVEVVVEGEVAVKLETFSFQSAVKVRQTKKTGDTKAGGIQERSAPEIPAGDQTGESSVQERERTVQFSDKISLSLDSLAYLITQIIQQREKKNPPCGPVSSQPASPQKMSSERSEDEICSDILQQIIAKQGQRGNTVTNQDFAGYDLSSIPLEKIPSRPGLQQTFVKQMPPPKPPEQKG